VIDEDFKKIIESNKGCAVIMAGSNSDQEHIEDLIESLNVYKIPYEVRICSAHKQGGKLDSIFKEYNNIIGSVSYIAVATGNDGISGSASYQLFGPVISSPPDAPNESCLTNPPGSSNAYIAHPKNVGKFIAQIYAGVNPVFRELLEKNKKIKIQSLDKHDELYQHKYKWNKEDDK